MAREARLSIVRLARPCRRMRLTSHIDGLCLQVSSAFEPLLEDLRAQPGWIIAACPGWPSKATEQFLTDCAGADRPDFQEALSLAKSGKYTTWHPL